MSLAMHSSEVRGALPRPAPAAIEIRCPSIETARAIRESHGPFTHLDAQDRRFRTVWLYEDTPEFIVEQVRAKVDDDRDDEPAFGQSRLTWEERSRLDQREGWSFGTKGFHAWSCKAIAEYYGVRDWTAHYDHELTVDEHKDLYPAVTGEDQSMREMPRDWRGGRR